jgi:hypothetical protein
MSPALVACSVGGGGVPVTPHGISPAYVEKATAKAKTTVAQNRRKLFISLVSFGAVVEPPAKNFAS